MNKIPFVLCLLFLSGSAEAQDPNPMEDVKLQASVNRAIGIITIALNDDEAGERSELDLNEPQKKAIQEISDRYSDMLEEGANLSPEDAADPNIMLEHIGRLKTLETELTEAVLMPHQAASLLGKVFTRSIEVSSGDTLEAIEEYYPDKIELDEKKTQDLKNISKSTKKEILEARKKFKAEVERIIAKSGKATRELFSDQEKAILGTP